MTYTKSDLINAFDVLRVAGYNLVCRYHIKGYGYKNEFEYKGQVRELSNDSVVSFAYALAK